MPDPYNQLSEEEKRVIIHKGTQMAGRGEFTDATAAGTYICRRCNAPLYRSDDKFHSGCGWPAFDDELPAAVQHLPDADGRRIEIVCTNCQAHLGHVFHGEQMTAKNTRHCVNSISLRFVPRGEPLPPTIAPVLTATAVFASGCYWGTEYFLQRIPGVISTKPGYCGGHVPNPSYREVCGKKTGHYEAVQVIYNPALLNYRDLAKVFFETHDPTQVDGQGPDLGPQYRSAVFVASEEERRIVQELIAELDAKGLKVATVILDESPFYEEKDADHHDYYLKHGKTPYCHAWKQLFDDSPVKRWSKR